MKTLYEIFPGREEGTFEVVLNPAHAVFQGHFPGNPVLPGVCSLMIVRECASLMAARPLRYATVRESKFLAAITPDTRLEVATKITATDAADYTLEATIHHGATTMLKLKARLTPDE